MTIDLKIYTDENQDCETSYMQPNNLFSETSCSSLMMLSAIGSQKVEFDLRGSLPVKQECASFMTLNPNDEWIQKSELPEELNLILRSFFGHRIEWASEINAIQTTKTDFFKVCNKLDDETLKFIEECHLEEEVVWLQTVTPVFFLNADFEVEVLPVDDGEENMLALIVYGSLSALEFREQRHAICEAMIDTSRKNLYDVIGIFQRRTHKYEWQTVSCYSSPIEA